MKKLPWLSLTLLLAAYITLSWLLYRLDVTWQLWAIVLMLALTQAFLLTTFSRGVQRFFGTWLRSDLGYFSVVLLLGMFAVFFLAWFQFFGHLLVLLAAEMLARLDLRRAGYTRLQALTILVLVSLLGLGVGGTAYYYKYRVLQPHSIEHHQESDASHFRLAAGERNLPRCDRMELMGGWVDASMCPPLIHPSTHLPQTRSASRTFSRSPASSPTEFDRPTFIRLSRSQISAFRKSQSFVVCL